MTTIQAAKSMSAERRTRRRPEALAVEDRVSCPSCDAEAEHQETILRTPDGALELIVLRCTRCDVDHPVWL